MCFRVTGFTLKIRGSSQVNHEVMKQNVLNEITDPLDEDRRNIDVASPYFFTKASATKRLKVRPRTERYSLVFDNRVSLARTVTTKFRWRKSTWRMWRL